MKWLDIAEDLPLGGKTRVKCCGGNKDAVISKTTQGYSYYCFKCDTRFHERIETFRLKELLEDLNQKSIPPNLPEDYTPTIPVQHRIWLYKSGITEDEYTKVGIGWSDNLQRIILPIYDPSGHLLYYQARAIHPGQVPKYANPSICKSSLLYKVCRYPHKRIVVTEDILSAIKVGRHTNACSILGTSTSDEQAALLSYYDEVSYWLDPDEAGLRGSKKGVKLMSLVTSADYLTSDKDPKNLPDRVLREILHLPPNRNYIYHGRITTKDNEAQGPTVHPER